MEQAANTKEYEVSCLLDPSLSESEIEAESLKIQAIITQKRGLVIQTFPLLKKRLFYPIKKQNQAYLSVFYFVIDPEELGQIKKEFRSYPKVLQFLILNRTGAAKRELELAAIRKSKKETAAETPKVPKETAAEGDKKRREPVKEEFEQSFEEKLKKILKG